jgi:hypothetical protein
MVFMKPEFPGLLSPFVKEGRKSEISSKHRKKRKSLKRSPIEEGKNILSIVDNQEQSSVPIWQSDVHFRLLQNIILIRPSAYWQQGFMVKE